MKHPRLRWGILGTGRIAASTIAAIREGEQGSVHAVSSRDPARAKAFALTHAIDQVHDGYQALLEDPGLDIIYVPLPISEHARWAKAALLAGKAVLVEKPFAMSAEQALEVFRTGAEQKRIVGEAMMYRFHPLSRRVRELVQSGAVGEVRIIRSTFVVDISDRQDIRWQAETGGGAMRDLGCYCIDVSRFLLNAEPDQSFGTSVITRGVDATFSAGLRFPCGAVANFAISLDGAFDCSYEVLGTTGRLRVDSGGMVAWPGSSFAITIWNGHGRSEEVIPPANHYQLMVDAFAASVREGAPYAIAPEQTLANHRWMDRLLSGRTAESARPLLAAGNSAISAI